jgi:TonB-linked SusC/RagA family outer membrane protein
MNWTNYCHFLRSSLLILWMLGFAAFPLLAANPHPVNEPDVTTASVSGTVTNEEGEPLAGASVRLQGTNQGALTDDQGKFSFPDLPDNVTTLVVSYYGYSTQEVKIAGRSVIDIVMLPDVSSLEEVVVTGYGTQKRANLTGAVTAVGAKEIEARPLTSVGVALQGNAPGVFINQNSGQPGRDNILIRIRGVGTLNNANPLVLVDGIEAPLNNINPDDIESISILKDAASAAIYGSRAANGVVLVTTKRSAAGSGVTFNYNGYYGISEAIRLPDVITDAATFAELWNEAQTNFGDDPKFTEQEIADFRANGPNSDFFAEMFTTAPIQQHNFSVGGATDRSNYRYSFGYLNQDGVVPKAAFQRFNTRLNLDSRVNDRVTIGVNLSLTRGDRDGHQEDASAGGDGSIIANITRSQPVDRMFNDDGVIVRPFYGNNNAWMNIERSNFNRKSNDILGATYLEVEILEGWKVRGTGAINYSDQFDQFARITFPTADPLTDEVSIEPNEARSASRGTYNSLNLTTWIQTTYEKTFGSNYIKLLGGFNQETHQSEWYGGGRNTFISNNVLTLNAGDPATATNYEGRTHWALQSFFGRANYAFADKYLFEANLRYDGSSRFQNNKWGLFPSFSAGWILSEEEFFNVPFVDFLKVRASWGQLGNQNIGNFRFARTLSLAENYSFGGNIAQGVAQTSLGNPDLKWETTTTTNIGLNLTLFRSHLELEADWFDRLTDDILFDIPVPSISGFSTQIVNSASVRNRGWELTATYRDNWDKFRIRISGNVTNVRNEVLRLNKTLGEGEVDRRISGNSILEPGAPINAYFGYKYLGIFRSQEEYDAAPDHTGISGFYGPGDVILEDLNGDGVIDPEDRQVIGNPNPEWVFGTNLEFGYAGFDLMVLLQGAANYQTYGNNELFWPFNNLHTVDSRWLDRWTPDNPDGEFPRLFLGTGPSTAVTNGFWLLDRSHLRLKNVQLGYSLPESVTLNSFIKSLRVYVNGQNLATFTNFPFLDPERPGGTNRGGTGFPNLRIYSVGANLNF